MTTVALQALNVLVHDASMAREVHWVAALDLSCAPPKGQCPV